MLKVTLVFAVPILIHLSWSTDTLHLAAVYSPIKSLITTLAVTAPKTAGK